MGFINIFKPAFPQAGPLINLSNIINFVSLKIIQNTENQTRGKWVWEQKCLPSCNAAPCWFLFVYQAEVKVTWLTESAPKLEDAGLIPST